MGVFGGALEGRPRARLSLASRQRVGVSRLAVPTKPLGAHSSAHPPGLAWSRVNALDGTADEKRAISARLDRRHSCRESVVSGFGRCLLGGQWP